MTRACLYFGHFSDYAVYRKLDPLGLGRRVTFPMNANGYTTIGWTMLIDRFIRTDAMALY